MSFQIGAYTAVAQLAAGSTASVWSGFHTETRRDVALKIMPPLAVEQVRREAALAGYIDHPNLVAVQDVAVDDEWCALVMAPADGGTLAAVISDHVLPAGQLITVVGALAAALAVAHERGVTHGDISPSNVLLTASGRPMLADLGAARASAEGGMQVSATPAYVAPEVARGAVPNSASDVFSLGAVMLHCLTGRPAWPADDLRDVVIQATAGQWPDPGSHTDASPLLLRLLRSMLNADPAARPGAATVLLGLPAAGSPEPIVLSAGDGSSADQPAPNRPAAHPEAATNRPTASPVSGPRPGAGFGGTAGHPDASNTDGSDTSVARSRRSAARDATTERRATRGRGNWGRHARNRDSDRGRNSDGDRARDRDSDTGGNGAAHEAGSGGSGSTGRGRTSRSRDRLLAADVVGLSRPGPETVDSAVPFGSRPGVRTQLRPRAAEAMNGSSPVRSGFGQPIDPDPTRRPEGKRLPLLIIAPLLVLCVAGGAIAFGLWWAESDSSAPMAVAPLETVLTSSPLSEAPNQPSAEPSTVDPGPTPAATAVPTQEVTPTASVEVRWEQVITDLDRTRSAAFAARDVSALGAVYTADSPALSTDVARIQSLLDQGLRVDGAEHQIVRAVRLDQPGILIQVTDEMPAYSIRDESGAVVGQTAVRSESVRTVELVATGTGYLIANVSVG